MSTEKERESHVYMAKLAEQAERYEGDASIRHKFPPQISPLFCTFVSVFFVVDFVRFPVLVSALMFFIDL